MEKPFPQPLQTDGTHASYDGIPLEARNQRRLRLQSGGRRRNSSGSNSNSNSSPKKMYMLVQSLMDCFVYFPHDFDESVVSTVLNTVPMVSTAKSTTSVTVLNTVPIVSIAKSTTFLPI